MSCKQHCLFILSHTHTHTHTTQVQCECVFVHTKYLMLLLLNGMYTYMSILSKKHFGWSSLSRALIVVAVPFHPSTGPIDRCDIEHGYVFAAYNQIARNVLFKKKALYANCRCCCCIHFVCAQRSSFACNLITPKMCHICFFSAIYYSSHCSSVYFGKIPLIRCQKSF